MNVMVDREQENSPAITPKKDVKLLLGALAIAFLYDLLFFEHRLGISYPVFNMLLWVTFFLTYEKLKTNMTWINGLLTLCVFSLASTLLFFSNNVLRSLNLIMVPILWMAFVLLATENHYQPWFRGGFFLDILRGFFIPLMNEVKPFVYLKTILGERSDRLARGGVLRKVLIGLLLSLPLLAVVIALLSSADLVFKQWMSEWTAYINLGKIIQHTLLIGVVAAIGFSYLWRLAGDRVNLLEEKNIIRRFDPVIVITVLTMLGLVYALFTGIQFTYLFGGVSKLLPVDLSFAEYARRGFFELVFVAVLNTLIVLACLRWTRPSGVLLKHGLSALNSILLFCTLIMLLSAHFRMALYEEAFGYTYLRVFTHAFMGMMALLLGVTLFKVWRERIVLGKWYITIGLICYLTINYVNVDRIIAQRNLERYRSTGIIDIQYLAGMSYDTTSTLIELAKDPNESTAAEARAALNNRYLELSDLAGEWQSFNLSEYWARRELKRVYKSE